MLPSSAQRHAVVAAEADAVERSEATRRAYARARVASVGQGPYTKRSGCDASSVASECSVGGAVRSTARAVFDSQEQFARMLAIRRLQTEKPTFSARCCHVWRSSSRLRLRAENSVFCLKRGFAVARGVNNDARLGELVIYRCASLRRGSERLRIQNSEA